MKTTILKRTNSDNPDFRLLITELDADLRLRNGEMMDFYDHHNIIEKNNTVVLAYIDDKPAGCGCFKPFDAESIEVKRMFVRPDARGNGISKTVLAELETWAREQGFKFAVLESASKQVEAHSLYLKSGYERILNYGQYEGLPYSFCFKKPL
ncbi:Acetyltransferase (GNAT) family protein [Mucilaginibacter gossypiicola]|uniref:Acetyltransferase (GNAT) family protein n=1 Tax=Mucilaginibacter gossypiicola TaxID=551995 RepID=A0A1H8NNL8_9SPHI|nr:GNAT family N-acetyltransferase [Mucilaginibacter gossypiicola]SEO31177.1 Acetyltransferase (GNAT) family protein [Mucilaginibacter gossypiicola]